jgi:hypothetical protein
MNDTRPTRTFILLIVLLFVGCARNLPIENNAINLATDTCIDDSHLPGNQQQESPAGSCPAAPVSFPPTSVARNRSLGPIADIVEWAKANMRSGSDLEQGLPSLNLRVFPLDIDHDGIPEVFVATIKLHGNGGGPYEVFKKKKGHYWRLGSIDGSSEGCTKSLPLSAEGRPRILTWLRGGAGGGVALTWENRRNRFYMVSKEEIHAGDSGTKEGNRRFKELFEPRMTEVEDRIRHR